MNKPYEPPLADVPEEAQSVFSSYFVDGQNIISREDDMEALSSIIVGFSSRQADKLRRSPFSDSFSKKKAKTSLPKSD